MLAARIFFVLQVGQDLKFIALGIFMRATVLRWLPGRTIKALEERRYGLIPNLVLLLFNGLSLYVAMLIRTKAIHGEEDGGSYRNVFPEPLNWQAEFGKQTLMVNAAIMDLQYRPTNRPWLIDLDLDSVLDADAPILS